MTRLLSNAERLDWLRLIRCENVGPVTFKQLLRRYGSAGEALEHLPELARKGGRTRAIRVPSLKEVKGEVARIAELGAQLIAMCEPDYPPLLRQIEDAPPLLIVKGNAALTRRPSVALVGARAASINGLRMAEKMAQELSAQGWLVVSGLARGIDGAAHRGALAGGGGTVAVIAGGIDIHYPPEHAGLQDLIAEAGLLVSEAPPGSEPIARNFPRRNRLIAGMSLGTVVIEAGLRSGSLITARLAADHGREVLAVPGSPLDARAKGGNSLIRGGAHLVESAADIIDVLHQLARHVEETGDDFFADGGPVMENPSPEVLDQAFEMIVAALDPHPVSVDEILRRCQLSSDVVADVIIRLDLAGRIERHPGNRISLIAL